MRGITLNIITIRGNRTDFSTFSADLAELLDTIPSEARFGDIIEEENMQFVEKCDDNVWEAILVRNDMNMDQATFERDETGGWGVYDGTRFHPISIPEDVEPKHVVVMPEGTHLKNY